MVYLVENGGTVMDGKEKPFSLFSFLFSLFSFSAFYSSSFFFSSFPFFMLCMISSLFLLSSFAGACVVSILMRGSQDSDPL